MILTQAQFEIISFCRIYFKFDRLTGKERLDAYDLMMSIGTMKHDYNQLSEKSKELIKQLERYLKC